MQNKLHYAIHGRTAAEEIVSRADAEKDFMELCMMLIDTRPVDDLKSHLVTSEKDEKVPELIDKLDDIQDDLATNGIEFDNKTSDFHGRCIKADTGCTITLGRGLDIFKKYCTWSIANSRQDKRKCEEYMLCI